MKKRRTLKLIRQKLIGLAVMFAALPMSYILDGDVMWPLVMVGIGLWLLTSGKLLSEITTEMIEKEIKENEDLK